MAGNIFQFPLNRQRQRRAHFGGIREFRPCGNGHMRRIGGKIAPAGRHICKSRPRRLPVPHHALDGKPLQYALPRLLRRLRKTIRAAFFRQLRQRHQKSRLRRIQPARLLAEPGKACGPDAFEIAAIGCDIQIEIEDISFAEPSFDLESTHGLQQFRRE
ncbi:hypothetical protein D3C71_668640 [compost metagenome]